MLSYGQVAGLGDGRVSGRALRSIQGTSRADFVQNLNPVFLCCYFGIQENFLKPKYAVGMIDSSLIKDNQL